MKHRLILLRHAKSSWADPGMRDFDRPLNERGKRDAPFMARMMRDSIGAPDHIISSDAVRAFTTAQFFAHEMALKNISTDHRIYEAPVHSLLEVVNSIDDQFQSVLMVGHNPGFSDLVVYLTGREVAMPTCSYVVIEFRDMTWAEVSRDTGMLLSFDFPKNHQ